MKMTLIAALIATAILVRSVSATIIIVGGSTAGWDISNNLTQWSASVPIFVNDSLLFKYSHDHDVVEVSQEGFAACNGRRAIAIYDDGETLIKLTEPGTRYFICARSNHCTLGLKLQAQVLDTPNPISSNSSENHTPYSSSCQRIELSQAWVSIALCLCYLLFVLETFVHPFWFLLDYLRVRA